LRHPAGISNNRPQHLSFSSTIWLGLGARRRCRRAPAAPRRPFITLWAPATAVAVVGALGLSATIPAQAATTSPTASATPDTGLANGQRINVRASGFEPLVNIEVMECKGTAAAPPKDLTSCEGLSADTTGYTDDQGNYVNAPGVYGGRRMLGFKALVLPSPQARYASIRCGPVDPCVLYVGVDFHDFKLPHVFVPISFAGGSTAPATTTTPPHSPSGSSPLPLLLLAVAVLVVVALIVVRRRARSTPRRPI
jgi:hypothetical protein